MRRILLLLLIGIALTGGEADEAIQQARQALQRGPVAFGLYSEEQLATALHLQIFGAQAPRADGPLAELATTIASAKGGDERAKVALFERWFVDHQVYLEGIEEAHARRCPPAETCLQFWTMWNNLPPGPTKARWLPILNHALLIGVTAKTMTTAGLLLGDEVVARLRFRWSNGLDVYGDWGQALGDPPRRHAMLIELLEVRSLGLVYFPDELWTDALTRADLDDPLVLTPLLRLLTQQPDLLALLSRFAQPGPALPALAARAASGAPLNRLLFAIVQPDRANVQPVITSLAEAMADGGWEGYPSYWRHQSADDGQPVHPLRLLSHDTLRKLWRGPWSAHRDLAAQAWADAIPRVPASQMAQLITLLPPATRLDDPLLVAALAHAEPRVAFLAAHQAALLEPTSERLAAGLNLWERFDPETRNWIHGPWLQLLALAVRQVSQHDDGRLRAHLLRSAASPGNLLGADPSYVTPGTLSECSELLGLAGLQLPVSEAIDRFMLGKMEEKNWYGLEDLAEPFMLDPPADAATALAQVRAWPVPVRVSALSLLGRYDEALALWDATPDDAMARVAAPLLWSRRPAAMAKRYPLNALALRGWGGRDGATPEFKFGELASDFHQALYQRLAKQADNAIPWSDWRFSMHYGDFDAALLLDAHGALRAEDLPHLLEVLAKRGHFYLTKHHAAVVAALGRNGVEIPADLASRSPICAELRLEQAFQSGAWDEVLRCAEHLAPSSRYGLGSLRRAVALHRLKRLDAQTCAAVLPELDAFQRSLLSEWLVGEGATARAQAVADTVREPDLDAWQVAGWNQAQIRLALAAQAPATAATVLARAYAEVRSRDSWAHLNALGGIIAAANGGDGTAIASWAGGAWCRAGDAGVATLEQWRKQAVAPAWRRALTWALAVARYRLDGASEEAMADWQSLAGGGDWWAEVSQRCLAGAPNHHPRLRQAGWWGDSRRPEDSILSSETTFGLALDPDQGQAPAIGERAVMIDPWGAPELLYRRKVLGPWSGWWLYLDGYRPMVRPGTWLHLARVDGIEEVHVLRLAPLTTPVPIQRKIQPQVQPPAQPAVPLPVPGLAPVIRLFNHLGYGQMSAPGVGGL